VTNHSQQCSHDFLTLTALGLQEWGQRHGAVEAQMAAVEGLLQLEGNQRKVVLQGTLQVLDIKVADAEAKVQQRARACERLRAELARGTAAMAQCDAQAAEQAARLTQLTLELQEEEREEARTLARKALVEKREEELIALDRRLASEERRMEQQLRVVNADNRQLTKEVNHLQQLADAIQVADDQQGFQGSQKPPAATWGSQWPSLAP
jgi:hypothetical protein